MADSHLDWMKDASTEDIQRIIDRLMDLHYSAPLTTEQEKILKSIEVKYVETYSEEFDRKWKLYEDYKEQRKGL